MEESGRLIVASLLAQHDQTDDDKDETDGLEADAEETEGVRELLVVVDLADALVVEIVVPVGAGGVDDAAEYDGPRNGAEGVHAELLETEANRVHVLVIDHTDGHLQVGQKGERVEQHEKEDARIGDDETHVAVVGRTKAVDEVGRGRRRRRIGGRHLGAVRVDVRVLVELAAAGQACRLEEHVVRVGQAHRLEYLHVAVAVRGQRIVG